MGCIEIKQERRARLWAYEINRNMGCIEILSFLECSAWFVGLIETWDVLKFQGVNGELYPCKINRNMGCIEILTRH